MPSSVDNTIDYHNSYLRLVAAIDKAKSIAEKGKFISYDASDDTYRFTNISFIIEQSLSPMTINIAYSGKFYRIGPKDKSDTEENAMRNFRFWLNAKRKETQIEAFLEA